MSPTIGTLEWELANLPTSPTPMKNQSQWISVKEKLPRQNQRVLAKYEGVYGPRVVTFWTDGPQTKDGVNTHFGEPPASEPATHWAPLPE